MIPQTRHRRTSGSRSPKNRLQEARLKALVPLAPLWIGSNFTEIKDALRGGPLSARRQRSAPEQFFVRFSRAKAPSFSQLVQPP
jgi:hypothetical protein